MRQLRPGLAHGVGDFRRADFRCSVVRVTLDHCKVVGASWLVLTVDTTVARARDVADRRERAPWYTTTAEPSLSDLVAKLRRVITAARCTPTSPGRPADEEIRAVQQAWAAASTP